ncbi:DNA repair protein rad50 [Dissophora globulifera]|uniref:DNA repair protein RAD50 n=1 Tax=Dissophora globulifera TaxID=979702 RepID=A0A9P6R7K7_9FUNG|nr:DNA repair protein rad50 [Dissophora globulifera]
MSNSPSIKAQVRLRFKNVNNQTMSVIRSLSVTVKKSSYTQKSLENVLAVLDPESGELVTLSGKCADVDAEIPSHLGVSQAILDNVIFCHQEDSNWPLSENNVLKKKFDEIFASTKYTNVLDSIKTIKKDNVQEIKTLEASLQYMRQNKEKADEVSYRISAIHQIQLNCVNEDHGLTSGFIFPLQVRVLLTQNIEKANRHQEQIEYLEAENQQCDDDIKGLTDRITDLQTIENTLKRYLENRKEALANIDEMEGTFELYSQSDSELKDMQYNHELSVKTADQERSKHEILKQKAVTAVANLLSSVNSKQLKVAELKATLDTNKKKQVERDIFMCELAKDYSIEGLDTPPPFVSSDVSNFVARMEAIIQHDKKELENLKSGHKTREKEIQSQLSDKKARSDVSLTLKSKAEKEILTARLKLQQLEQDLIKYETTEEDIRDTEEQLTKQKAQLLQLKSSDPGLESLESKKRGKEADIQAFEDDLSILSDKSAAQFKHAGSQAKLTLLKNKHSERDEKIRAALSENYDTLQSVLEATPSAETAESRLRPVLKSKENAVKASKDALEQCKRERSNLDIRIESVRSQIRKYEATLSENESKINAQCGEESFLTVLAAKDDEVSEKRKEQDSFSGVADMYQRFISMTEKKHACPLCSRGFDAALEAQFMAKLQKIVDRAQKDDGQELEALEAELKSLQSLNSVWDAAENLRSTELPALRVQLTQLEQENKSAADALEVADMEFAAVTEELEDLRRLVNVAKELAELSKANTTDSTSIKELEMELLSAGSTQSVEEIQAESVIMKQKVEAARRELAQIQREIATLTRDIQQKEKSIQMLNQSHNELLNKRQLKTQLLEQVAETKTSIRNRSADLEQQVAENQSVVPDVQRLEEELELFVATAQKKERGAQDEVADLETNFQKVQMYNKDLERVNARSVMTELSKLEAETETLQEEVQQHTDKVNATEKQMQALQEQLSEFKNLKHTIEDNLRYRRYKERVKELDAQIAEASSKMSGNAKERYSQQLNRLNGRKLNQSKEHAELTGELRQLKEQTEEHERSLQGEYKDAVQKYHEGMINYKTMELASQDLDKYMKALQSAIVEYHSMKMEELNKSIKELWTNTYQGTDIDTIAIRSDQEGLRANQSYSYKVVMIQRGRELEMRGRCSAGQKVLASIIIRLALAESFSLNCGILALDEPTTNLDEANVRQLARSLRLIIDSHRQQSNFQLIVITHDEDFLRMLNLSEYVDWYYRVQKNAEQHSTIAKLRVTEV